MTEFVTTESATVFISYSRRDVEQMRRVRAALREAGLSVWTDEGIEPGTESWRSVLGHVIEQCEVVVVLFSPDSAESTWVQRELDYAELHDKTIYPLLVRGEPQTALPFGYTTFQFIDVRHDADFVLGIRKLIETIIGELSEEHDLPNDPAPALSEEPSAAAMPETAWRWVASGDVRLSVPMAWKDYAATPAQIQRLTRLFSGNNDDVFFRAMQDTRNLGHAYSTLPGVRYEHHFLVSDITALSPVIGFVGEFRAPYLNALQHLFMPLIVRSRTGAIRRTVRERYQVTIPQGFQWMRISGSWMGVAVGQMDEQTDDLAFSNCFRGYVLAVPWTRRVFILSFSAEISRYETIIPLLDQIAHSLYVTF